MKIVMEQCNDHETEIIVRGNLESDEIQKIFALLSDYRKEKRKIAERILLLQDDLQFYVSVRDIIYFNTEDDIVFAHTARNTFQSKEKLYQIQERLCDEGFIQISKSVLINSFYVESVQAEFSGNYLVALKDVKEKQIISRHYFRSFKEKMLEETL